MTGPRGHDRLAAEFVSTTVDRLSARIEGRFPDRGVAGLGHALRELVEEIAASSAPAIRQVRVVRVVSRALMVGVVALATVALVLVVRDAWRDDAVERGLDWLPLLESTINDLVFAGIAVFFLWSVPERLHRSRLLGLLHRLRSFAHVVDMHQLTKDPERLRSDFVPNPTMPIDVDLDLDQMEHYLSYCSEMLSLVGKAAALVAEESQDSVVLDTVSSVEVLTTNLATKIWQKIGILSEMRPSLD